MKSATNMTSTMARTGKPRPIRFLIMSDTHDMAINDTPLKKLPPADVILHCGDLTDHGDPASLRAALAMILSMKADVKLVVAGNHDGSLDRKWYLDQGGNSADCDDAVEIVRRAQERDPGLRLLNEGTHTITLSGAQFTVYASPYTPESGAFAYRSAEDRYNPIMTERPAWHVSATTPQSVIPDGVDIVMTHGPPKYMLDRPANDKNAAAIGCEHLVRAIGRTKPQLHAFGHVHSAYGIQRVEWNDNEMDAMTAEFVGKNSALKKGFASLGQVSAEDLIAANRDGHRGQTVFVNAALMDSQEEPAHMPWLIDLEL